MSIGKDLLDGPPPTLLPADSAAVAAFAAGADAEQVVRDNPTSSLAWAVLSDQAWADGQVVQSYAFARVGYHRGLDSLRRNGWKGHGPVPWSHEALWKGRCDQQLNIALIYFYCTLSRKPK